LWSEDTVAAERQRVKGFVDWLTNLCRDDLFFVISVRSCEANVRIRPCTLGFYTLICLIYVGMNRDDLTCYDDRPDMPGIFLHSYCRMAFCPI
jgi:hypothetical protein